MPETSSNNPQAARVLRNLYFTRTVVQLIWAGTVLLTAANNPGVAATLLILYPLWDVACTLYERKSASISGPGQYLNAGLGTIAAIGIGITAFSHPMYSVAIFGAWALAAGLLQLGAGVSRRKKLSGQWAMILSGLQSGAAGVAFLLGGLSGKVHIKDLGGYAVFGGIYFLISGILLTRKIASSQAAVVMTLGLLSICCMPKAHAQGFAVRNVVLVHGVFGNAAGLMYVAALAPDIGQSGQDLKAQFPVTPPIVN